MLSPAVRSIIFSGRNYSAEARQYFARVPQMMRRDQDAYASLIDGLVAAGLWAAKTDALWFAAAPNQQTSLQNMRSSSFTAGIGVQPTFTPYQGFTGNGSTQYLTTGFTPSTAGGVFTQNSNHFGAYVRTSRTSGGGGALYCVGGAGSGAGPYTHIVPLDAADKANYPNNDAADSPIAATNAQGHWINTRTASNLKTLYRNGSSFGSDAAASTGQTALEFWLLCLNVGSVFAASADQIAAWHVGSGLAAGEAATYSSLINTALTSLGTNVY